MAVPVLLAVDGNSLVHRSYHAQANSSQPAWAVRGLLTQLVAAVDRIRPTAVVVGFDDPQRSLRRERWPEYKAHRTEKLDTLVEQLSLAVEVMRALGVCVVVPDGLEADDVLASTAAFGARAGAETVIMTSDRDAFPLIDARTRVLRIINGGVDASPLMTPERLVLLLGVHPWQYRDLAALRGDPSDNLPGVRGVGPRNGARLLAEFGSARAAFGDLDRVREVFGPGLAARLGHPDARTAWERNCAVMTAHADIDLNLDLSEGPGVLPLDRGAVAATFRRHNLMWSMREALRVLAGVEETPVDAVIASGPDYVGASWPDEEPDDHGPSSGRGWSRRRLPSLRRPAEQQLALF
jgi:DNA polymerase-1